MINIISLLVLFIFELFLNEWQFFVLVIIFSIFSVFLKPEHKKEKYLYIIGVALGFAIEVGLGLIHRQQMWTSASLLGVPVWLPFIWGLGFVYIRRIGNLIVK